MKLSKQQQFDLWGNGGPYSEVDLKIETRILDDSVSRIFLVVEAKINPLTFRVVKQSRKMFPDDIPLHQLLDHAKFRGKHYGYVVCAFMEPYEDETVMKMARLSAEYTKETILKMHKYVMELLDLRK